MTRFHRLARCSALAAACACAFVFALAGLSDVGEARKAKAPAQAQAPTPSAQGEQPGQAAHQAYDAGLKEFANGHYQPAIEHFSTALTAGGLSAPEMAKALYTRGVAYKKQGKSGLAISDLTSALWLKNGLTPSEREKATQDRAEAFKMAGVQDIGKGPERVIGEASPAAKPGAAPASTANLGPNSGSAGLSAAAIAQAAASEGKTPAAASPGAPVSRQDPSSQSAQDAARARAAYAPAEQGLQSAASASVVEGGAAARPGPTTVTVSTPGDKSSSSLSSVSSSVTGFFSNMFGGGAPAAASTPAAQPAGVTTASTTSADVEPAVSGWSQSTTVSTGASRAAGGNSATAAIEKHDPVATTRVAATGKYKIHIAALRSREAAEALAQQLVAQHGADLSNHVPTVDEAVIGSMGTFYRVRIGGYASQEEPRGVCNKLRSSGLDCLVVTN